MADYYQVPEVVYQHYPELIDDYIRAGTGAARGYDPWSDGIGAFAKGFGDSINRELNDYYKGRAEERTFQRRTDFELAKQEEMRKRQDAIERVKTAEKDRQLEEKRAYHMGALQDYFLRRAPKMLETPGFQGYDAEGMIDQRPPREEMVDPSESPMETYAQMFREDPDRAMGMTELLNELKGPGAQMFNSYLQTPSARNTESQIKSREARDDMTAERDANRVLMFKQTQDRLYEQLEENKRHRLVIEKLEAAGLDVQKEKLLLAQENQQLRERLAESQINRNNAAADKSRKGGGGKDYTPLQQQERRNAEQWVIKNHPDIPKDDARYPALVDWYASSKPWKAGSSSMQVLPDGTPIIGTERKPTQVAPPMAPNQTQGGTQFQKLMEKVNALDTISDEGMADLRKIMNKLPVAQREELERALNAKKRK